jgi:hypothetical protein
VGDDKKVSASSSSSWTAAPLFLFLPFLADSRLSLSAVRKSCGHQRYGCVQIVDQINKIKACIVGYRLASAIHWESFLILLDSSASLSFLAILGRLEAVALRGPEELRVISALRPM